MPRVPAGSPGQHLRPIADPSATKPRHDPPMDAYNWIFLVSMIAVWVIGSALVGWFGAHLFRVEKHH